MLHSYALLGLLFTPPFEMRLNDEFFYVFEGCGCDVQAKCRVKVWVIFLSCVEEWNGIQANYVICAHARHHLSIELHEVRLDSCYIAHMKGDVVHDCIQKVLRVSRIDWRNL